MSEEFKLFIRNIPYTCTEETLNTVLQSVNGYISSSINKDRNSGNSRGNGVIVFDSQENGFAFLNNNNVIIDNRRIKFFKFINTQNKPNTLFVTGLEKGTSSQDLRKTFIDKYGNIGRCYVKHNHHSDKTIATIDVKNIDCFDDALQDTTIFHGDVELHMKRFIDKKSNIKIPQGLDKITKRNVYIEGFNAGRKYGFNECLRQQKPCN